MTTWKYRDDLMRSHAFDDGADRSICARTSREGAESEREGCEHLRCRFCKLIASERAAGAAGGRYAKHG